ncbi:MAG: glycosyltransferase family 2 protein [Acutalibacteraceae bacterium]|nr:glycosyltransferase family 2 protein [Acutalibacteraceae bacterium]
MSATIQNPVLYIVIPCYNEQEVLPVTAPLFSEKLRSLISSGQISEQSKVLFVNDGSRDSTWDIIKTLCKNDSIFKGISLSRNRGHQNALLAGLMEAKEICDITVSIDCDGQDDINAIDQMVAEYKNGAEVVYGVRKNRKSDTFFKRCTAQGFYKFLKLLGAETVYNHADYRLLSAKVLTAFADFKEVNIYLRGMIPLVGFKSTCVYYERSARLKGKSHYPLRRMLSLAFDGITSLSTKPIRLITAFGMLVAVISFIGIIWSVISFFCAKTVTGWASLVSILCFLGGVQLISLGIIGEYIGKIYLETKARPRYIISERTEENDCEN